MNFASYASLLFKGAPRPLSSGTVTDGRDVDCYGCMAVVVSCPMFFCGCHLARSLFCVKRASVVFVDTVTFSWQHEIAAVYPDVPLQLHVLNSYSLCLTLLNVFEA